MHTIRPKNWQESEAPKSVVSQTELKNKIKTLVDKPKDYYSLMREVHSDKSFMHVPNKEVLNMIKEVDTEWHPEKFIDIKQPTDIDEIDNLERK